MTYPQVSCHSPLFLTFEDFRRLFEDCRDFMWLFWDFWCLVTLELEQNWSLLRRSEQKNLIGILLLLFFSFFTNLNLRIVIIVFNFLFIHLYLPTFTYTLLRSDIHGEVSLVKVFCIWLRIQHGHSSAKLRELLRSERRVLKIKSN